VSGVSVADLDAADPVPTRRDQFAVPRHGDADAVYLLGNSLGLPPRSAAAYVQQEIDDWGAYGVEGYGEAARPWMAYGDLARLSLARLVGAQPDEVVVMNTLSVNLHLMLASCYRPTPQRPLIVIEDAAFPSDSYAVRSQAEWHGLDPDATVVRLRPREGEALLQREDVLEFLARDGERVAVVLLGAVNYLTGELLDVSTITAAAHRAGAMVGWDLAHAIGNVPMLLHDWDVDFAVWCSYKYLNGGPGAVGGAFVHERLHGADLPRLSGWWGADPAVRFLMEPVITPPRSAAAWALSNVPVLSTAPLLASLEIFDGVGLDALRGKSVRLTRYLESALAGVVEVITPSPHGRRGAQLSLRVEGRSPAEVVRRLRSEHGVFADAREPDVVRLAPAPLYNTFADCERAADALAAVLG
jgi:kynureninase